MWETQHVKELQLSYTMLRPQNNYSYLSTLASNSCFLFIHPFIITPLQLLFDKKHQVSTRRQALGEWADSLEHCRICPVLWSAPACGKMVMTAFRHPVWWVSGQKNKVVGCTVGWWWGSQPTLALRESCLVERQLCWDLRDEPRWGKDK